MLYRVFYTEDGKLKSVKITERDVEKAEYKALKTKLEGRDVALIHTVFA